MSERLLDRHLGQCEERHKDIVRRHEEANRAREGLSLQVADVSASNRKAVADAMAEVRAELKRTHGSYIGVLVSIASAVVLGGLALMMKVMKLV